jgi:hypothetical protein
VATQLRRRLNDPVAAHQGLPTKSRKQGGKAMSFSRTTSANGIEMFLLEQGAGPLLVLCHGWPELSYSWRHQIPGIAAAGYYVGAPDMREFGETSTPDDIDAYTIFDHVGDMVALVAALGERQAVIVGHDWGAPVAWQAVMFRVDIFSAVAGLSIPRHCEDEAGRLIRCAKTESAISISIGNISKLPVSPSASSSAMSR